MSPRTTPRRFTSEHGRPFGRLPWLCAAVLGLVGCKAPPIDGNSPPPAGVMEGTVLYVGPRPVCDYENGVPVRARGRVVLTLFVFDNPPPPEGSATSALNLLAIPGTSLFSNLVQSCAPEGQTEPDPEGVAITSSIDFTWPELPLGTTAPVAYRVQGFYDHDESFNPFFNITQSPTSGDIAGAAVDNPQAETPQIAPVEFGTEADHPLGQLVGGVSVSLGLRVITEPPVFYATTEPMASETPLVLTSTTAENEQAILDLNDTRLHLYDGLTSGPGVELNEALTAGGLSFDITAGGSAEYAWYVREVDLDGDGSADQHPALFSGSGVAEFYYYFPIVILERVQPEIELSAGIPTVVMLTALPQYTAEAYADGEVLFDELRVAIPPIAVAITNPNLGDLCRIPIFAPGTTFQAFESAGYGDCQELPTGRYGFNALNGVTDGEVVADGASPTGFNITGGRYSNQNWGFPNALGEPAQFVEPGEEPDELPSCEESPCAVAQSTAGAMLIYDATPETFPSRRNNDAVCLEAPSIFGSVLPIDYRDEYENGDGEVQAFVDSDPDDEFTTTLDVRDACCAPVAHLCDVPLCGLVNDVHDPDRQVRASPTRVTEEVVNGVRVQVPDCMPFYIPTVCCLPEG